VENWKPPLEKVVTPAELWVFSVKKIEKSGENFFWAIGLVYPICDKKKGTFGQI
jgi:hypothetical protein